MIYIVDNFLSQELLDEFLNDKSDFIEHRYPDKSFWVKMPSEKFNQYVINKIEKIEGKKIKNILSFFREAKENIDAWTLKSVIGYKQNRLLSYPCEYFHSKYPKEFKQSRKVFVMFYKIDQ